MFRCPKCNELNGDNRETCWKCNNPLEKDMQPLLKKVCPKCGLIYLPKVETCTSCGTRLTAYTTETARQTAAKEAEDEGKLWMYVVAVIIPLAGLIMGCVYLSQNKISLGKSIIMTSVAVTVAAVIIRLLLVSCSV